MSYICVMEIVKKLMPNILRMLTRKRGITETIDGDKCVCQMPGVMGHCNIHHTDWL